MSNQEINNLISKRPEQLHVTDFVLLTNNIITNDL